jgi:signal transduction histidine kinase
MLRRKLLLNLGLLILLLLGCAVASIGMLQHVLAGLNGAKDAQEMQQVAQEFRWVVLGLALTFVVILNVAILALLRGFESGERRRMEVVQQVAVAVNHELNNCVATIDLQLRLVGKRAPESPKLSESLRQIDQSLRRITSAVQSLKNVRRIVLTDYLPGTKMLDLHRSVQDEQATIP